MLYFIVVIKVWGKYLLEYNWLYGMNWVDGF